MKVLVFFMVIVLTFANVVFFSPAMQAFAQVDKTKVIIHYAKDANSDLDWNLWLWEIGKEGKQYEFNGEDDFGKVAEYEFEGDIKELGFIVKTNDWKKDGDSDRFIKNFENGKAEIWLFGGDETVYTEEPNLDNIPKPRKLGKETELIIHYHRFDKNYDGWNLWIWPFTKDGGTYQFTETDDFGVVAKVKIPDTEGLEKIGFIVKYSDGGNEWANKEFSDRFITKFTQEGKAEIWLAQGNEGVYYNMNDVDLNPKFVSAKLNTLKDIAVETNLDFTLGSSKDEGFIVKQNGKVVEIEKVYSNTNDQKNTRSAVIKLKENLSIDSDITVEKKIYGLTKVVFGRVIKSKQFNDLYYYDGDDLGNTYTKESTMFKLWTPFAKEAYVVVYDKYDSDNGKEYKMEKKDKAVWQYTLDGDNEGKFYKYKVNINGDLVEAVDPYAKAVAINGEKSSIVNLEKTNPDGWDKQNRVKIKSANDAIIYELHTRDLSMDENSGIKNKGKFLGLIEEGTKGPKGTKTGLNHIKDLGVTHVQLLPIYDYGSVDETGKGQQFNWGYDPVNYNAVEGSYSTDAYKPDVRIKEFKEVVKGMHKNGLGVIMDVVYNHMYSDQASAFNQLAPGYYFRYNDDGTSKNESGCGNVIASENKMVRKYIVDSVKYWATEYKLDGFRFDLMGLLDVDTMNDIREELSKIDPSIITIGEGWNMGATLKDDKKANQINAEKMKDIAHFNDSIRDGLKGSVFDKKDKGFVNGKEGTELVIKKGIVGAIKYDNIIRTWRDIEPNQAVTYVEAHDNNTLWDKLELTNPEDSEEIRKDMHRLADAIILTSQGVPFIHAGQEFLRTKYGDENSYKSSDDINKLDWQRKYDNMDTVEYFKGLIKMRKSHPAFRMATANDIRQNLSFVESPANTVAYTLKANANGDEWNEIFVAFNANREDIQITLPAEKTWAVVVNKEKAGVKTLETIKGNKVIVPALSTIVMHEEKPKKSKVLPIALATGVAVIGLAVVYFKKKK
ncbi:type I pullulanase [Clostridiaceae bacterium M8S5]|nr:type I pullulanase [Clostridiaceae bacterium M8S5]